MCDKPLLIVDQTCAVGRDKQSTQGFLQGNLAEVMKYPYIDKYVMGQCYQTAKYFLSFSADIGYDGQILGNPKGFFSQGF